MGAFQGRERVLAAFPYLRAQGLRPSQGMPEDGVYLSSPPKNIQSCTSQEEHELHALSSPSVVIAPLCKIVFGRLIHLTNAVNCRKRTCKSNGAVQG